MKKYTYLFIFMSFLLASCQSGDDQFEVGLDLVKSQTEISMVDSFEVKLSTVKIDSIATSGSDMALIGFFENNISGNIEANSYFNFDLSENAGTITDDVVFDSITIQLNYSDYLIGDSTQMQRISVYRLTDELALREVDGSDTYLFNTSSFPHEEIPCGHRSYYPHAFHDSIQIKLDDALGLEILQMIKDDTNEVETSAKFNTYLKGFVIKPDTDSGIGIVGFSTDSIKINLYTHVVDFELEETTYEFNISDQNTHFNQIIPDRTGTLFENLADQREELESTSTNNLGYIQGSAGILVRLDFPTLNEIYTLEDRILLKAELILRPATESFQNELPEALHFYETDKINQIGDQLSYEISNTEYSVEASLYQDELYNENSFYSADISTFISEELSGNYYNTDHGLLVVVPISDFLSTADHLILNGENASGYKPTLNLYFLTYE